MRNLIELPLGSIFYATHPFVKKLTEMVYTGAMTTAKNEIFIG